MRDTSILTNNGINVQQSLELLGDMEFYDETLEGFLDMADEKISKLESFKNTNDMANYAIEIHALKSDSRYLGFITLADLSYESEMKSKAGDSVFVAENHPKILAEAKRVINLAQTYMGREQTAVIPGDAAAPAPVAETTPVTTPEQQVAVQPQVVQPVQEVQAQPAMVATPTQQVAVQPQVAEPVQEVQAQPAMVTTPTQQVTVQPQVAQPVQEVQAQPSMVATPTQQAAVQPQVAEPLQQVQTQPAMVATPIQQVAVQPQTIEPQKETIQFFPADNYQQQDIMSQALYMNQQTANPQVAGIKQGIIFVVDDSPLVANFVKKIFSTNYDVLIANDGQKAIEIIADDNIRSKIKTCLLDLNMPNVSGFDVMDHFREKGFFVRTPVAVISGAEDTESIEKANSYPIVDILAKPFNERDVQRVVEKCLAVYF